MRVPCMLTISLAIRFTSNLLKVNLSIEIKVRKEHYIQSSVISSLRREKYFFLSSLINTDIQGSYFICITCIFKAVTTNYQVQSSLWSVIKNSVDHSMLRCNLWINIIVSLSAKTTSRGVMKGLSWIEMDIRRI